MAHKIESDLDFGSASRITNLPAPAADSDAARRVDLVFGQVVIIVDEKAYNVDGGTFTSGAVRKRDLNTIAAGSDYVTLSGNEFTLDAGKWFIEWTAPAYRVGTHWSALYDGDDALVAMGSTAFSVSGGDYAITQSKGCTVVELDGTEPLWIGHQCAANYSTFGFGFKSSFAGGTNPSIYTCVTCRRLS
jgi:hypothetical protein